MKHATLALVIACLCLVADARPVRAQSITNTPTSGSDNVGTYITPSGTWSTGFLQAGINLTMEWGLWTGGAFQSFAAPQVQTQTLTGAGDNTPYSGIPIYVTPGVTYGMRVRLRYRNSVGLPAYTWAFAK